MSDRTLSERVSYLEGRVDEMSRRLDARLTSIETKLDRLTVLVTEHQQLHRGGET